MAGTNDDEPVAVIRRVVTYEMLSGVRPFPGPESQDYVRQHAEDTAPSLSRLEPELGLEVSRVIERALMKEPDARFSNAEAFGQALRGAASTEVVRAPAERSTERWRFWPWRLRVSGANYGLR